MGAAGCLALLALFHASPPNRGEILLAAVFSACTTLAWLFPLHFAFKTKLHVDAPVTFTAVLLLDPALAMLVAGLGTLIAHGVRRGSRDWAQALFNTALVVLQTGIAGLLLAAAGWNHARPPFDRPALLVVAVTAGLVMYVVNVLAVAVVVGLQAGLPPGAWLPPALEDVRVDVLTHLAQQSVALAAALLVVDHPWGLVLLAPAVLAIHDVLRRQVELRLRAEEALRGTETSLTEAQRIARLGSWDWDLSTGKQRWSDETYRILGFVPQSFPATAEIFLSCIHAEDRPRMVAAIRRSSVSAEPFDVDPRIVRADGSERVAHLRGEVVLGTDGRPAHLMGTVHDVTERKALEAQLAHQAFYDALTDLPNRTLFTDRLARAMLRSDHAHGTVAVLFLDLDGFKLVNDSLGHEAGDKLLVAVAERLRATIRPGDTAARFGGDEFAVLLEEMTDPLSGTRLAECLIEVMRSPFTLNGHETFVGASVGLAQAGPGQSDPDELLRAADTALYHAKAGGRGTWAVYDPAMRAPVVARLERETGLRRAIERGELRLLYQPQVELATGRVVAVEALVRWQHPDQGLLPPVEFIQLAEETGLVLPLGRWVLREACWQARAWQDELVAGAPAIGVNLSARQFQDAELAEVVGCVLKETGLPPGRLELEITETVAMTDLAETRQTLRAFRRLGVQLAIDDFGTGYASLGHLRELAPDVLKVDRSFVAGLGRDAEDVAIVRAVTALARDLGLAVTAEGIETAEQVALLRRLGVDRGQGFYFAAPLSGEEIGALLARTLLLPDYRRVSTDALEHAAPIAAPS